MRKNECITCNGTGQIIRGHDGRLIRCPTCLGDGEASGFLERKRPANPGNNPREDLPKEIIERERAGETAKEQAKPVDSTAPSPGSTFITCRTCRVQNIAGAPYCKNCGLKLSRNSIKRKIATVLKWLIGSSLILALMVIMVVTAEESENYPTSSGTTPTQDRGVPTIPGEDANGYMLELINAERTSRGIPPVKLGENKAAQLHAEAALEGCYSAHWDRWGLKPNHRYTLAGGTGADAENVSGHDTCTKRGDGYRRLGSLDYEIRDAVNGLMESRGHRKTILNPVHTVLNVGIAHNNYNINVVQQFSSDYVIYQQIPAIEEDGFLRFQASTKKATLDVGVVVNTMIFYDPPPQPLTQGQLYQTYSYCNGPMVAYIVRPRSSHPQGGTLEIEQQTSVRRCTDPYSVSPSATAPDDQVEAEWADIKAKALQRREIVEQVHRIAATKLEKSEDSITVAADLQEVLESNGPGIYSVALWGKPDHMEETTVISEYAIFWKTEPPPGNPYQRNN